jgi:glycerophosphoryl diester phosphodiesterase
MIEFDVALTRDGHPIIMHDPTVDRTTNGTGWISELTFDAIRQLDAGMKKNLHFSSEQVPILDEVLNIMPQNIWLNIHLKGGREVGEITARAVLKHGCIHQAFLAVGDDAMEGARSVEPDILICNMENQGYDTRYVDETIAKGCGFIQLYGGMASSEDLERLKTANVHIYYFDSNNASEVRKLLSEGIDFVLVDKVEEMLEAARTIGIEPQNFSIGRHRRLSACEHRTGRQSKEVIHRLTQIIRKI